MRMNLFRRLKRLETRAAAVTAMNRGTPCPLFRRYGQTNSQLDGVGREPKEMGQDGRRFRRFALRVTSGKLPIFRLNGPR